MQNIIDEDLTSAEEKPRKLSRYTKKAVDKFLLAAINLSQADMGNLQLLNPETNALEISAQHGFTAEFLRYFGAVRAEDNCACGRAMRTRTTITVDDVDRDPLFTPYRPIAAMANFRAVQSVPLVSKNHNLIGVVSTHYRTIQNFAQLGRRINDYFAMSAADVIEWYLKHDKTAAHLAQAEPG